VNIEPRALRCSRQQQAEDADGHHDGATTCRFRPIPLLIPRAPGGRRCAPSPPGQGPHGCSQPETSRAAMAITNSSESAGPGSRGGRSAGQIPMAGATSRKIPPLPRRSAGTGPRTKENPGTLLPLSRSREIQLPGSGAMTSPYAPLGFAANRTERALAGHTLTARRTGTADGACAANRGWDLSSRRMSRLPAGATRRPQRRSPVLDTG
jgi:hypothetical protein